MERINGILRTLILLTLKLFSFINVLIPKNKKLILFYSNNNAYNDNNYALLNMMLRKGYNKEYKIIQSVLDYKENQLKADNLKYVPIYLAPFYFLRAKFVFYDGGTTKITPSKHQVVTSLWHGIPLKKMGFDLEEKAPLFDRYNQVTYFISPHQNLSKIFERSFDLHPKQILVAGYPRNDFLFQEDHNIWEKFDINPKKYSQKILWMPTFRKMLTGNRQDSDVADHEIPITTINNRENLEKLNSLLQEKNILLVIKPHPYCILNNEKFHINSTNILKVTNDDLNKKHIVNYSFVALFDALITDYSSVLFDYILLDKPIAFAIEDISQYQNTRGMNFSNPFELMPGDHLKNFDDLYSFIKNFDGKVSPNIAHKKILLRNQFHYIQDASATKKLLKTLGLNTSQNDKSK